MQFFYHSLLCCHNFQVVEFNYILTCHNFFIHRKLLRWSLWSNFIDRQLLRWSRCATIFSSIDNYFDDLFDRISSIDNYFDGLFDLITSCTLLYPSFINMNNFTSSYYFRRPCNLIEYIKYSNLHVSGFFHNTYSSFKYNIIRLFVLTLLDGRSLKLFSSNKLVG